jgi:ATP-dependent Lon protease
MVFIVRMSKMNTNKIAKKDSAESGTKPPDRKKPMAKKRSGGAGDDDDSVDSRGNIRGLIAYDDSEEEFESGEDTPSDMTNLSPKQRREIRRSARAAAMKARNRIRKTIRKENSPRKVEPESESESESESAFEVASPKKRGFVPRKKVVRKIVEESEEESEEEEEEDEDDDDDEDEDDEDESEEEDNGRGGLIISFGGDETEDRMVPKRHNMKKETPAVKKFVELITKPREEDSIDCQIDEFKRLSAEKQTELLTTLDRNAAVESNTQSMMFKILGMKLTPETQAMVLAKYNSLQAMDPGAGEYYKHRAWLEKFTSLPLGIYKDIPVKLSDGAESCGAFMARAQRCLGEAIYGQEEAKIQILQFIASKIANPDARGLSLLLAGPPGIGKTSLIKNGIAKALGWPFQFVSLGGDSDASTYVGHQLVYEGSHAGKIVNSLVGAKSMSMILMFDELDKISNTPKGEEVQNLLVHLTDPVQNGDFEDKYLSGIPLDLSKVLFTFSANDLGKIDRVLMDRMVVIELQGYTIKEKMAIAQTFLLPTALKEVNLDEKVSIGPEVLEHILKEYASEEKGVRELKRCVEAVVQKINMLRIFNTKDLPFHIPEFHLPFVVKKSHVDLFLKKKSGADPSVMRMYT